MILGFICGVGDPLIKVWFLPELVILLLCNGCLFTPGSVWTGVVYCVKNGCNRAVFLPKGKNPKGRLRM